MQNVYPQHHEILISNFKQELITTTGYLSTPRNIHITTALHYFSTLTPTLNWESMTTQDAKLSYSQFLSSDLSDSTRALRSRYIVQFLKYLCEEKINQNLDYTVICKLKTHKAKPIVIEESKILTETQVKDVLSIALTNKKGKTYTLPNQMKTIIAFLFGGGMRIGEVLRLTIEDVTYKLDTETGRGYYKVSVDDKKTEKRRTTIINRPYLMNYIKSHLILMETTNKSMNLFTGTEKELKYSYIRYWFNLLQKNGYPTLTSHKGRAHNISRRIANGEPISSVSMTTHGSPNAPALKYYLRLNESDIVKNMMKFG
ncbi:MAG: site-specific integrase [Clostridia bacterium]|jgi:integrase|nr:site-specific integrase [Clostridia bacterium]